MPTELILGFLTGAFFGLVLGGILVWSFTSSRANRTHALAVELQGELSGADARLDETRDQLTQSKSQITSLTGELRKYERAWSEASAKLKEREQNLQEQKALVEKAKSELADTFKALAAQALQTNNRGFLDLAEQKFQALKKDTTADLDARKTAIEVLVKPVGESLVAYQKITTELEEKRQKEMGSIGEQLRGVALAQAALQTETQRLVNALKSPQVRGRWGEIALRRTAELAEMTHHCDFGEQESVSTEDGLIRPDMTIKLPASRKVVVDSKVPLSEYLKAVEATTDEDRSSCLEAYANQVLSHISKLSAKEYWGDHASSLDFVVLFIPNDSFLAAATQSKPTLLEEALKKKVVLASPTTFYALLRAIEYAWRQHTAVENAHQIRNLGQELSDRFAVLVEHLTKVGNSLGKAVESYNSAVTSFEQRILTSARRFRELGAVGRKLIEPINPLDVRPRGVTALDGEDKNETEVG